MSFIESLVNSVAYLHLKTEIRGLSKQNGVHIFLSCYSCYARMADPHKIAYADIALENKI